MAKQIINVGTTANDRRGDSLRAAFQKVNANFTELYTTLGLDTLPLNLGAFEFTGSTLSTTDSSSITIDQATTVTSNLTVGGDLLPSVANGGDLGSAARPWKSLYVSSSTIYIGTTSLGVDSQGNLLVGGQAVADVGTAAWANITGKPTFASVATSGAYADLTGQPTIPTSFDRLSNSGDEVILIGGANPFVTFPAITGGDQLQIQGAEVSSVSGSLALTSQDNLNIIANGSGAASGGSKNWTFSADGSLTIPGDIRSEGNINIDINLSDSTLQRWQFGEDGELTLPDGSVFTGTGSIGFKNNSIYDLAGMIISNSNQTTFPTAEITIPSNASGSAVVITNNLKGWAFENDGSLTVPGDIQSDGDISVRINRGDSTQRVWRFGNDGDLTLPGNFVKLEIDDANPNGGLVVSVDAGVPGFESKSLYKFGRGGQFTSRAISVTNANGDRVGGLTGDGFGPILNAPADKEVWISTDGQHLWRFTADRDFVLPYGGGNIRSEGNINIDINLTDSTMRRWQFGEDGDLIVPGSIQNGDAKLDLNWSGAGYVMLTSKTDYTTSVFLGEGQASLTGRVAASISVGEAGQNARTTYEQKVIELDAAFAADLWTGAGYPAGPTSSQALNLAKALNPLIPDAWITIANELKTAWDTWQEVLTYSDVLIAVGGNDNVWKFDPTGNLTLPNNAVIRTDGSNVEIGGVANFNVEASGVVNIYTDTNGETPYQWQFGDDGSLTLPGDIHGAPLLSPGPTPSQIGRVVNITPADDASDKAFRFSIDQLGETFSRAYLQLPEAEVDKQVAAVFPHSNNTAGYIFTQGTNTNDDGLNDAFNIFYNAGDIKLTAMTPVTGTLNTWKFGDDGNLSIPGGISSTNHLNLDAAYDTGYSVYIGNNHPTAGTLGGVVIGDTRGGFVEIVTTKLIIGQTSVPTHSYGSPGDIAGEVAFDNNYIYYCKQNYVNNSTDIWVRVGWTSSNW